MATSRDPRRLFLLHEIETRYVPRPDLGFLSPELLARVATPQGAAEIALRFLTGLEVEHVIVIPLSVTLETLSICVISKGTADRAICSPRDVYREAVRHNATGILLAHNHPKGGGTDPSPEDLETTKRLSRAGKLLGIELLDHLIVSDHCPPYSFREHSLL